MNSLFSTAVLLVSLFCLVPLLVNATWTPAVGDSYFIDLTSGDSISTTNPGTAATVYDVNATATSQSTISALQALGIAVVCYVPIGAASPNGQDYSQFPKAALGNTVVSAGATYTYLDVTNIDIYPVIEARIDAAAAKGCDGIDLGFDAEYGNATSGIDTGFNLTVDDALLYYKNMANYARIKGLIVGLRNGPAFVDEVVNDFADFAIVTNCFYVDRLVRGTAECKKYNPFISRGKPVFAIEYYLPLRKFCKRASNKQFTAGLYPLSLNGTYAWCSSTPSPSLSVSAAVVSPSISAAVASPSISSSPASATPSAPASLAASTSASTSLSVAPSTSPTSAASPSATASGSSAASPSASSAASPSASSAASPSASSAVSPSASVAASPSASASVAASPSVSSVASPSASLAASAVSPSASLAVSPSLGTSPSSAYCITCAKSCGDTSSPLYTTCTTDLSGTGSFPTATSFCCAADVSNGFSYSWTANGAACNSSVPEHKLGDLCTALSGTVSCALANTAGRVQFTCS